MDRLEELKTLTANMVASYDERVGAVEEIIEKSLGMLEQNARAGQIIRNQLKETLAKVESVRKKDFDILTAPLLSHQEKRGTEIKEFLHSFLKNQRESARQLKRMIQEGILNQVPDWEKRIQAMMEETKARIRDFQKEQTLISEKMQCLFRQKEKLTLQEFKKTLDQLQAELGLNKQNGATAV